MGWGRNASITHTSLPARDVFLPEGIQRIHCRFEINAMFRTAVQFFSSTCHVLKTWFELTRAKLYRNDLKKILRREVRVIEGKITVNVWRKSRGNRFWSEFARGSS